MLVVEHVSKIFKRGNSFFSRNKTLEDVVAVDDISFEIKEGEILGLIGTNGAGKTTTMRMIATMLSATKGKILVEGLDVSKNPSEVRKSIGIMFGGDTGLYDRLTARENIQYFARLNGMSEEEIDKRIEYFAENFSMRDYLDRRCGKFSKGMKQKTCFARSIIHNPKVMLFDEPSSGLDILAREEVCNFIKKCKEENKTILLSSHDMTEVEELCDRVAILKKGKLLDTGTIPALCQKYNKTRIKDVFMSLVGEDYE